MGEPDQKETDSKLHTIPDTLGAYSSCDAKKDIIAVDGFARPNNLE